jgi:hypothetical protein
MATDDLEPLAPGICPACYKPILRKELKIAKEFKCPNCQALVRTSRLFRTLLYLTCYGIPTVIVLFSDRSLVSGILLWLVLAFAFAMLYIAIATAIRLPKMELVRSKDGDFQSLDLKR